MTEERQLLYIHKLLHEAAKHKQGDLKDLQSAQVDQMNELLGLLSIEDGFAQFCKTADPAFLAEQPNSAPSLEDVGALKAMGITALRFPCQGHVAGRDCGGRGPHCGRIPELGRNLEALEADPEPHHRQPACSAL